MSTLELSGSPTQVAAVEATGGSQMRGAALSLVNIGISSAKPPLWAMPTMFLSGSAAATGIATINSLGNLGGFVGPYAIGLIKESTGSFEWGLYFVAALLVLSAIVTLIIAGTARKDVPATPSNAIQKG